MRIGAVDTSTRIALIAEVGNNHEGSVSIAREMIEAATDAGADAVKLQTVVPSLFVSPKYPQRLEQMSRFALSLDETLGIIEEFAARGITVFTTPLDLVSAREIEPYVSLFKVSSGDLTWTALLHLIGASGKDVIVSTGLAYMHEVSAAVAALVSQQDRASRSPALGILHCVSAYPATQESVNLGAIRSLQAAFPSAVVGYSDHTLGTRSATYSVIAGARIVEKHFTLDKSRSTFRDHALSADVNDFRELRVLVDEARVQLGSGVKEPDVSELQGRTDYRRSLTIARSIARGRKINEDDLLAQRPASGLEPARLREVVGMAVNSDLESGHVLTSEDLMDF